MKRQKMTQEFTKTSGLIQCDFICRQYVEPIVQLYVSKEKSFPIPLEYIDVMRSTQTDRDVAQEERIDDN